MRRTVHSPYMTLASSGLLCLALSAGAQGPTEDLRVPILQGLTARGADPEGLEGVGIAADEGWVIPAQVLFHLRRISEVEVEIASGPAQFLHPAHPEGERLQVVTKVISRAAAVELPMILPGDRGYDSVIVIRVDGEPYFDPIPIRVGRPGNISWVLEQPGLRQGILRVDPRRHFLIADPQKVDADKPIHGQPPSAKVGDPDDQSSLIDSEVLDWCPPHIWEAPKPGDDFPTESASRPLVLFRPGRWSGSSRTKRERALR